MAFPCFRGSLRLAFLDDDEGFSESIAEGFQLLGRKSFFGRPAQLDQALELADALVREERALLARVETPRESHSAISEALAYLRWEGRHDIFSLLICDHAMPAENGVSVCSRHAHHGLRRILLTGVADAAIAVDAFNGGHIDAFLPKQHRDLPRELCRVVDEQIQKSMLIRGERLLSAMPARNIDLLSDPEVARNLRATLVREGVVEYVALPDPFGLVCLDGRGEALWVQIEDEASLHDLSEAISDMGWAAEDCSAVRGCKAVPNVEIPATSARVCAPSEVLSESLRAFCAVFRLDEKGVVRPWSVPVDSSLCRG